MDETNAFSPLNQLMMQQNISPMKQPLMNEQLLEMVKNAIQAIPSSQNAPIPNFPQQTLPQMPVIVQTSPPSNESLDMMLKASPSASSDMSSQDSEMAAAEMMMMQNNGGLIPMNTPLQPLNGDSTANIAAGDLLNDQRSIGRHETWMECFTTTKHLEYEALLFSVYVAERNERKFDGWTYFDCLHRLQSKCRYRVRAKKQDEFYIVEEKGVHNHGAVEPVGQAGSHAGLPKTIREIVDRSYNENWTLEDRTVKVDEEIKRLGLPANPRLGRQIDNRVAYLRRVKNLHESRRISEQVNGVNFTDPSALQEAMMNPAMLQALMDQNGGKLTVEKGMVEQILGPQQMAELVSNKQDASTENQEIAKPMAMNPNPEFYQLLQRHQEELNQQAAAQMAMARLNCGAGGVGQENMNQ